MVLGSSNSRRICHYCCNIGDSAPALAIARSSYQTHRPRDKDCVTKTPEATSPQRRTAGWVGKVVFRKAGPVTGGPSVPPLLADDLCARRSLLADAARLRHGSLPRATRCLSDDFANPPVPQRVLENGGRKARPQRHSDPVSTVRLRGGPGCHWAGRRGTRRIHGSNVAAGEREAKRVP